MRRKTLVVMLLVAFCSLALVGCGGSGGDGEDTVNSGTTVYDSYSNTEFAFKYPESWTANEDHPDLDVFDGDETYEAGVAAYEPGDYHTGLFAVCLDSTPVYGRDLTDDDLINLKNNAIDNFKDEYATAQVLEESITTLDGQHAIKVLLQYDSSGTTYKAQLIMSYKVREVFLLLVGSQLQDYNDKLGLLTEMLDSFRIY